MNVISVIREEFRTYGTYLIPAVLIVIIFQILMMLIGSISGGERHVVFTLFLLGLLPFFNII